MINGRYGVPRPLSPPRQGHRLWTLSALQKIAFPNIFPHVAWETEREPTGAMKTKKIADGKIFSSAIFLFSGMPLHPAGGALPPSPWSGRAAADLQDCSFIRRRLLMLYISGGKWFAKYSLFHPQEGFRGNASGGVWGPSPRTAPFVTWPVSFPSGRRWLCPANPCLR